VIGTDGVSLVDPSRFCAAFEQFKGQAATEELKKIEAEGPFSTFRLRRQQVAKRKGLERHKRLWCPFRRALPLQALEVGTLLLRDPAAVLDGLESSWAPVFEKRAIPTARVPWTEVQIPARPS